MALKPKTKQLIWSLVTLVVLAALTAFINSQGGNSGDNSAGTSSGSSAQTSSGSAGGWVGEPGVTRATASDAPADPDNNGSTRDVTGGPNGPRTTSDPAPTGGSATASSEVVDNPQTGIDPDSGLEWVTPRDLPPEAGETLALIAAGGPYPFPRNDDQTFGNREGILPDRPNGYYREYTVITPGSDDRGARRIVAGEQGELYYTDDHYDSFRRIAEAG